MQPVAILPWMTRTVALVIMACLGLQTGVAPVLAAGAPDGVFAVSRPAIRSGEDAFLAPLRQSADTKADNPQESGSAADLDRIAALTTLLNQQGPRSVENLERVSAIEVRNLTVRPEYVVDARVERATAARAAAAEAAAVEAARSAEAEAEAQAQVEGADAAALAADQADDEAKVRAAQAAASATREAETAAVMATREANASTVATATADARAAASAVREAEAATARAEAQAAAVVESNRRFLQRVTMLLLALALLIGGFLGLRFWRNRKEPFVLKAIPVSGTAHAHA